MQHRMKLTGTLLTCSGCMQAKGGRALVPTATSSGMTHSLQRVSVDISGPRKIASAEAAVYLILFKDDATRMGSVYLLRTKCVVDVAAAMIKFLPTSGSLSNASERRTARRSRKRCSPRSAGMHLSAMSTRA